ncbi:hypothetical protein LIER_40271 [Lithospermum erythrorhizon]|uniref:Retrotransposon Copia-like N-terminal domain-containing protein n=1 Tax=Lithospermum erythrorhizon TaxID=34254 RepID=A0AAV3QV76_LITER
MTYDNYISWKRLIIIFLRGQKVLAVVDGTMPCPDSSHPQYDMWIQCNDIALSWIHVTLNPSVNETLLNYACQLAHDAWVLLEQLFQDHTSTTRMHLRAQFQHFPKGSLSMDDYLQQLHSLYSKLHGVGENVKESDLVAQVLLGLPSAFNAFITVINPTTPRPSFSALRPLLISEDARVNHSHQSSDIDSSMFLYSTTSNQPKYSHSQAYRANYNKSKGKFINK